MNRRNKHIDIAFLFLRVAVRRDIVCLNHCPSEEMIADILTKPLGRVLLEKPMQSMKRKTLPNAESLLA